MTERETEFTVGELKSRLSGLPDDTKLSFAGGLTFSRVKRIADDEVFLEFAEFEADLSPQFRKMNPSVKVAFCSWVSDGEVVQTTPIPRL